MSELLLRVFIVMLPAFGVAAGFVIENSIICFGIAMASGYLSMSIFLNRFKLK